MSMDKRFIFVNDTGTLECIFNDLMNDERVKVLCGPCKELDSAFLKYLRGEHLRHYGGRLPFKWIWSYSLKSINWEKDKEYFVIFNNASLFPIDADYLLRLQKQYCIKYVLHMNDHWMSLSADLARRYAEKVHFDYIFSVDDGDVQQYGFIKSDAHYSLLVDRTSVGINYDLYFIGQDKGRLETLYEIYDRTRLGG